MKLSYIQHENEQDFLKNIYISSFSFHSICVSFVKFELVCVCWVDSFVFSIFSMKSNVSSYFCFMFLNKITLALLSCLLMLYLPLSTLFMSHLCSCTHISISLHSESPYSQPSPPPHFMILFLGFQFQLLQILLDQLIGFLSLIFFTPKFPNSLQFFQNSLN